VGSELANVTMDNVIFIQDAIAARPPAHSGITHLNTGLVVTGITTSKFNYAHSCITHLNTGLVVTGITTSKFNYAHSCITHLNAGLVVTGIGTSKFISELIRN
jgi:hypothetical protein